MKYKVKWPILGVASFLLAFGGSESGWYIRNLEETNNLRGEKILELEANPRNTQRIEILSRSIASIESSTTSHASLFRGSVLLALGIVLMNYSFVNYKGSRGEPVAGGDATRWRS